MPLPLLPVKSHSTNGMKTESKDKTNSSHTNLSHIEAIFSGCIEDSQNVSLLESQLTCRVWVGGAFKRIVIIESNKLRGKKTITIMALTIEDEGKKKKQPHNEIRLDE